jgi:hypothetical protein
MGMEPAREHPGDHLSNLVDDLAGRVPSRHLVVAESRLTAFGDLVVIDARRADRGERDGTQRPAARRLPRASASAPPMCKGTCGAVGWRLAISPD